MDDLLDIGKRPNFLAARKHAQSKQAAHHRPLVEEVSNGEVGSKEEALQGQANSRESPLSNTTQRCIVCHERVARYNCPQCNIPYCSIQCFRAPRHSTCSQAFSQRTLEQELVIPSRDDDTTQNPYKASKEERKQMMEILSRLRNLGDDSEDERKEEGEETADENEIKISRTYDIDNAPVEDLLAMLTPAQRDYFQVLVSNTDQGHTRAYVQKLLQGSGSKEISESPWYIEHDGESPTVSTLFAAEVLKLERSIKNSTSALMWNIVAVYLSYVYVLRHLGVKLLQGAGLAQKQGSTFEKDLGDIDSDLPVLEPSDGSIATVKASDTGGTVQHEYTGDNIRRAQQLIGHLVPFLYAKSGNQMARTVLGSAEDVTLWIVSRLGNDVGQNPASLMQFLYKDLEHLIHSNPRITENSNFSMVDLALSDLYVISPKSAQRKILFYAALWHHFQDDKGFSDEIREEKARLKEEINRVQEQETWQAAQETISQEGGVILPM